MAGTSEGTSQGQPLATTGQNLTPWLLAACILIFAGIAFFYTSRD